MGHNGLVNLARTRHHNWAGLKIFGDARPSTRTILFPDDNIVPAIKYKLQIWKMVYTHCEVGTWRIDQHLFWPSSLDFVFILSDDLYFLFSDEFDLFFLSLVSFFYVEF